LPGYDVGMFRELRYGVVFFLSAMAGAVAGHLIVSFPRVRSGDAGAEAKQAAELAIVGAIAGGCAWLFFKSTFLVPKSGRLS
jgi:hypothetical protein